MRIDDRLAARDDVGNHMPCAGANPEAVAAKPRREDEARSPLQFTDCGNAIGCAVDIARPDIGDRDALEFGQQFAGSLMCPANLPHVGLGVENPVPFHRRYIVKCPFRHAFMALAPPLESPRGETSPAAKEHGQEFAAELELLRGWTDARTPADRQRVSTVATPRKRYVRGGQGIRQAICARRHGKNGRAHGSLWETNSELIAEGRSPCASCHDHRFRPDGARFGHHTAYPAGTQLYATSRAMLMYRT